MNPLAHVRAAREPIGARDIYEKVEHATLAEDATMRVDFCNIDD